MKGPSFQRIPSILLPWPCNLLSSIAFPMGWGTLAISLSVVNGASSLLQLTRVETLVQNVDLHRNTAVASKICNLYYENNPLEAPELYMALI